MNLKTKLAKSTGEDIITHTDKVVDNIKTLITKYKLESDDADMLILAAKLHDIGKLTDIAQKFLKKNKSLEFNEKFYTHNIIGWYFIKKYLNHKKKDDIANLVLWHHANLNSCENLNESISKIKKQITDDNLNHMKEFCSHYEIDLLDDDEDVEINPASQFYLVDNFYRSILVTSDVYASSDVGTEDLFLKLSVNNDNIVQEFLNSERTQEQLKIVASIGDNTTTLIKAPAGYGKTMLGLLWTMKRPNKLIWVCPTNVISESVYDNILNEMRLIGMELNVELYLSGERKKANNPYPDFTSDIVVTNIDNFIKPCVTNSYGGRSLMIYDADVIFDEVHEYDFMECALFAAFTKIMDKRHNKVNSTTLLLTATPTTFRFLNKNGKDMIYLPNKTQHYSAVHTDKYKLHFFEKLPNSVLSGEFVFFSNTIYETQNRYLSYTGDKLISHGRYLEEDKNYKKNLVLSNYGKNGKRIPLGVFTSQFLTTSCDYSVSKMIVKTPNIQMFFQSLGRLNRWGGMGETNIYIITEKTKSDRVYIGDADENKLQELFITKLKNAFENKSVTLDELYSFYNVFLNENLRLFNDISITKHETSKNSFKEIYPRKNKEYKSVTRKSDTNKLRKLSSVDEIFIRVFRNDTENKNDYVIMNFNVQKVIGNTRMFDEDETTYKRILKIVKKYENYNKYRVITPEIINRESVYYDTPYPVFNHVYNSELGLRRLENNK